MPEVRFLKVFQGYVRYNKILDIENKPSSETIKASSFPHTKYKLHVIALLKIPPKFYGEISGRITRAHVDLGMVEINAPNEITWLTFDKQLEKVTFPQAGNYQIEILVGEMPIHSSTLILSNL